MNTARSKPFWILLSLLTLVLAAGLSAQTTSSSTAKEILALVRQATGGGLWNQFAECKSEGSITVAGKTGTVHSAENLVTGANVSRADIAELGVHQAHGVDTGTIWQQDDAGDIRLLPSGADWQIDDMYVTRRGYWRPNFGGAKVTVLDPVTEQDSTYDRLQFQVPDGHGFTLWINRTTHLIERVATGSADFKYLGDYRRVDGVLVPFSQRKGSGDNLQVVTLTKRTLLKRVNAADFAIPYRKDFELPASGVATVPAEDGIIFQAKINGKGPYKMLFDTGSINLINSELANQLGLQVEGETQRFLSDAGALDIRVTHIATLQIGDLVLHNQTFRVMTAPPDNSDTPVAAVGYEVFRRLVVKVDYQHQQLSFYNAATFKYSGSGAKVPLLLNGVTLEVDGRLDGVAGTFALDSGNEAGFSLDGAFVKQNNLIEALGARYHGYSGRSYAGALPVAYFARVKTLQIGDAEVHNLITYLSAGEPGPGGYAGNIGRSVLRQFNVTFDCMRGNLYLEKNANWGKPGIFNRAGIVVDPSDKGEKVMTVLPGSPGEAAGLTVDDLITKIDGHAPSDDLDDPAFLRPAGTVVHVTVKHGDQERQVEVTLKEIL